MCIRWTHCKILIRATIWGSVGTLANLLQLERRTRVFSASLWTALLLERPEGTLENVYTLRQNRNRKLDFYGLTAA